MLELSVPPPAPAEPVAQPEIPVDVVYEDADLLIVNKPAGLVVHPSAGHDSGTLVNALLGMGSDLAPGGIAGVQRPGIVHRLDRDTSGLLMVARTDAAQGSLQAQLKARRVKKTYLALVQGAVAAAAGRIEAPIGRDPGRRTRMAVVPDGRQSTTGYRVRERFAGWTLLELDLDQWPHAPDPRPPRGDRPPGRRRRAVRHRDLASWARWARPAVPPRVAARAHVALERAPDPGGGAAPVGARGRPRGHAHRGRRWREARGNASRAPRGRCS